MLGVQQAALLSGIVLLQLLGSGPSMMIPHSMTASLLRETMNKM